MVGCDSKCVCTDVAIKCPQGELVATAVAPRALLASDFAAQLSPRTGGPRPVHVLVHNAGALPASCFGPLAMSVCSSSHSAL